MQVRWRINNMDKQANSYLNGAGNVKSCSFNMCWRRNTMVIVLFWYLIHSWHKKIFLIHQDNIGWDIALWLILAGINQTNVNAVTCRDNGWNFCHLFPITDCKRKCLACPSQQLHSSYDLYEADQSTTIFPPRRSFSTPAGICHKWNIIADVSIEITACSF